MDFDEQINRFGTHSVKWDMMEPMFGVPAKDGIAMWVADMEFRPPTCVQAALEGMLAHGLYGYFGDESKYLAAIQWVSFYVSTFLFLVLSIVYLRKGRVLNAILIAAVLLVLIYLLFSLAFSVYLP